MAIETPDSGGLICGFLLQPQGAATPLSWDTKYDPDIAAAPVWLHFNLADTRATNWIATCEAIPHDARELLLVLS